MNKLGSDIFVSFFYLLDNSYSSYLKGMSFGHMTLVNFAFLHVLTGCSVSCASKRFLFDILHRM